MLTREDLASPMAVLESIMLTAVIDAHKDEDIMCADMLNNIHSSRDARYK